MLTEPFDPFTMMMERPIPKKFILPKKEEGELEEGELEEGEEDERVEISILSKSKNDLDREEILERLQKNGLWITKCDISLPYTKDSQYVSDYEIEESEYKYPSEKESSDSDSEKDKGDEEEEENENEGDEEENEDEGEGEGEGEGDEREEDEAEIIEEEYDLEIATNNLDYNEDIHFVICSEAKLEKPPGKGSVNEKIPDNKKTDFIPNLSQHKDWRKKLCNSFVTETPIKIRFSGEEYDFQSVDHYLHFSQFSSLFDTDIELKNVLLSDSKKAEEIVEKNSWKSKKLQIDIAEWNERKYKEMYHALYAKFSQNTELIPILLATNPAKLLYRETPRHLRVFYELMWLRKKMKYMSSFSLKKIEKEKNPIKEKEIENEKPGKKRENKTREDKYKLKEKENLDFVRLGDWERRLPKQKEPLRKIIMKMPFYMNNRKKFIQKLNELFAYYRGSDEDANDISCDQLKNGDNVSSLLQHQRVVRDYLNLYTPYRGVLLYHSLGAGKSLSSIAIAEGFKSEKRIFIMLPASLKTNYWTEIMKHGDPLFKRNQYWEFVPSSSVEVVQILAKALQTSTDEVRKRKGAWMVDVNKSPNFDILSYEQQSEVDAQIQEMINNKYKNIHYNANNLKTIIKTMMNQINGRNPFDHSVVVIDEAHNFVSKIVNKLKVPSSVYSMLYHLLMEATDCRVVMLSGTPILNYPNEMGVMFNLLRGYIKTWEFKARIITTKEISQKTIVEILEKEGLQTYDFIQYSNNKLTLTRNPFGFVNYMEGMNPMNIQRQPDIKSKKEIKINKSKKERTEKKGGRNTRRNEMGLTGGVGAEMRDYKGVISSKNNNLMNDNDFVETFIEIMKKNGIILTAFNTKQNIKKPLLEKALYDSPEKFQETFIQETTKENENALIHINVLRNRILGLTSYFRSAQEKLLPQIILDENGFEYHVVKIPMSDYQFSKYAIVRKEEYEKDEKAAKRKRMRNVQQPAQRPGQINTKELFTSSYRSFSRAFCNFVFPDNIKRPTKDKFTTDEGEGVDEVEGEEDEGNKELIDEIQIDGSPIANIIEEGDPKEGVLTDTKYQKLIEDTIEILKTQSSYIFTDENLQKYSPKFMEIMRQIQNPENNGLHLLYSNFRTLEGIGIFKLVLEENGMTEFQVKKQNGKWIITEYTISNANTKKFVLYTGTESEEQKEIVRNIYNGTWNVLSNEMREVLENMDTKGTKNKDGSIIQLFMITAAGAEGINLRNTRFVHIMEPYWHNVRSEQVIGRARRICSHQDLPESERNVKVFIYLSVMSETQKKSDKYTELIIHDVSKRNPNKSITTDEYLLEISQMKQEINQQFLRIMKETAMDCSLYLASHNKKEKTPLVCYGFGKVNTNEFISHPILENDLKDDNAPMGQKEGEMGRVERWKGVAKTINGVKYAMNPNTNELYNLAEYNYKNLIFEGMYQPNTNTMIPAAQVKYRPIAKGEPTILPKKQNGPEESNKIGMDIIDITKLPAIDVAENTWNVSASSLKNNFNKNVKKCNYTIFFPDNIKPAFFPFVTNDRNLTFIIKSSCNISPEKEIYDSKYNSDKLNSQIYQNINKKSILTSIDYIFNKMKTGVFVRIHNNILANFIVLYNLEYKNDFAQLLKFKNGMTATEYFKLKDPKGKGKWNTDLSKWNATNCLLRNEAEDDSPTLAYLSQFYDMIVETCHARKINDTIFFINRKDFPYLDKFWNESYDQIYGDNVPMKAPYQGTPFLPILSQSTSERHADIAIPTGDDWENISQKLFVNKTRNYKSEKYPGFECTNGYLMNENQKIPEWKDRKTIFFWRGMGTGCGSTTENNPRFKLSKISEELQKKGNKTIDAGIVNFTRRDKKIKTDPYVVFTKNIENIPILQKVDRFDQLKYKFIFNLEGNSAAYRFGSLFKFGFCVLNVVSQYKVWFEPFLEDRVHCIFVKNDLSDLEEIMEWCLNHDKECEKIAENGRKFYDKYFNKEFVYDYLSDIFNKTSSLIGQNYYTDTETEFVPYKTIIKPEMDNYKKKYKLNYDSIKVSRNLERKGIKETILIVPFRENKYQNRREQLDKFIQHYSAIGISVLIVTQSDDGYGFNRGALLNIGYDFLLRVGIIGKKINYVIMHDVDLLFPKEFVEKYYGFKKDIIHFGKNVKNYYDYPDFLGGAIQFSTSCFERINGFPNNIFGWGGEDDALKVRISAADTEENKIVVYRPNEEKVDAEIPLGTGQKETKEIPELIAKNKNEDLLLDEMIWKMNGLNTIHYKVIEKEKKAVGIYNIVVDIH